uniref:Uncharacterized protein n=1 Tax=Euplotes crassus TaxID=5936 RepID=A0A7S3KIK9_EUPCR|mmetsp:Transcript_26190/g.26076  ORF Transcript_26190/g.26076 Transcript_26190/m.26076 type:complete len:320 (+) Transcript_26190:403-1362(+)
MDETSKIKLDTKYCFDIERKDYIKKKETSISPSLITNKNLKNYDQKDHKRYKSKGRESLPKINMHSSVKIVKPSKDSNERINILSLPKFKRTKRNDSTQKSSKQTKPLNKSQSPPKKYKSKPGFTSIDNKIEGILDKVELRNFELDQEIKQLEDLKIYVNTTKPIIIEAKSDLADIIKEKKRKRFKDRKIVNKIVTQTGYVIDLSHVSTTIEKLCKKYEKGHGTVSFLRPKKNFDDQKHISRNIILEKKVKEEIYCMEPSEFGTVVKEILKEKLELMGPRTTTHLKTNYDHVDANLIDKQKDQIFQQRNTAQIPTKLKK